MLDSSSARFPYERGIHLRIKTEDSGSHEAKHREFYEAAWPSAKKDTNSTAAAVTFGERHDGRVITINSVNLFCFGSRGRSEAGSLYFASL
jgi:hypothetical protein